MKWIKQNSDTWVSGVYKIVEREILAPGSLTKRINIYHCYNDGSYKAQAKTLDQAKEACEGMSL